MIFLLAFSFVSCATWKQTAVTGYEVTGVTLTEIHSTAKSMCGQGTLQADDCEKIKSLYSKARLAYITAGDALTAAINAEDAVTKQKSFEAYQKSIIEVSNLVPQLLKLAEELGIKTGGN